MKIVITDGYTLNPGDIAWENIAVHGDLQIFDRTREADVIERCAAAEIIVTNKTPISSVVIEACAGLKCICVTATGYNVVDVTAAAKRNIVVCNVPAYGTDSVAQHTFALLLEMTNRVGQHARSVRDGEWERAIDWSYTLAPIQELAGKTIGIVGFGHIGRQVSAIAAAFNMKVYYYSRQRKNHPVASYASLEDLFRVSDIISLHCPLTPDNTGFVNKRLITLMKPSALLINTARGPLINEQDLADALNAELIAGAALDVLSVEPPSNNNPLLLAKNCLITPHNAWMSKEARKRIVKITAKNIDAFLSGKPQNQVN